MILLGRRLVEEDETEDFLGGEEIGSRIAVVVTAVAVVAAVVVIAVTGVLRRSLGGIVCILTCQVRSTSGPGM